MHEAKFQYQPQTPRQAVLFAEAHLRATGYGFLAPFTAVREHWLENGALVTASVFPSTILREKELIPGLKLRAGSSVIEIIRNIPTNKEIVYKTNSGGLFRMPSEKFLRLAKQQGYKKIWNLSTFLSTLKGLLKPVLDVVPLMWVLRWVVKMIRRKPVQFADKLARETDDIDSFVKRHTSKKS